MPRDASQPPLPKPQRFVWPPRQVAPGVPAVPVAAEVVRGPVLARTWRDSLREAIDDTRRVWLDLTLPRLDERFAERGFVPDPPHAYCHKCGLTADRPPGPDGCEECVSRRPQWQRIVRLGTYTPPLADVIRQIKFTKWRRLGHDLGRFMGEQIAVQLPAPRPSIVLVPVPMSWRRRVIRGMDHSLAICRGVCDGLGGGARVAQLLKRQHGPSQLQVLPSERSGNVGRMIQPKKFGFRSVAPEAIVIVVDDVMTTGATMRAACRAVGEGLAAAGLGRREVWAAVAARTELANGDRSDGETSG